MTPVTYTFRWTLTDRQEAVLDYLRRMNDPCTSYQVAEAMRMTRRQIARVLDQLVTMKLVTKRIEKGRHGKMRYRPAPQHNPKEEHRAPRT